MSQLTWTSLADAASTADANDSDAASGSWLRSDLPASKLCRSRKGIADYVDRIKAIGNAVPSPIAFEILKAVRRMIQ